MADDTIKITSSGKYNATLVALKNIHNMSATATIHKYAMRGVEYLQNATPVDTGKTMNSWRYEIEGTHPGPYKISFYNDNVNDGMNIAILLDNGHATRNGGWVEGLHYIEPAVQQAFEELADELYERIRRY